MGQSRASRYKRSHTGAARAYYRKKRKFELGRVPANTRLGDPQIKKMRTLGGNKKYRAIRMDSGNFSWGSEGVSRKSRIVIVTYHPSNNEFVRTNTLTKSAIVQIDATPFRQWFEAEYGTTLETEESSKRARTTSTASAASATAATSSSAPISPELSSQIAKGTLLACISSRPGQTARCDGNS